MKIIKAVRKVNEILATVAILLLSLFVIMQVISRYLLGSPLSWSEELSRYLQIWMVMLGAAIVMRRGKHLAIDIITAMLPPALKKVTDIISYVAIIFFYAIICYYGVFVTMNAARQTAPATGLPMCYVYAALPVGAALILMEAIIRLIRFIGTGKFDEPAETEEKK